MDNVDANQLPLYYGEFDAHKNKALFSKRKFPDSPSARPPLGKSPRQRKGGSPSRKVEASAGSSGSSTPTDTTKPDLNRTISSASLGALSIEEERHPLDIPASSLSRELFMAKHPFMGLNIGHQFEEKPNDEAVRAVAASALGTAFLCQDARAVLPRPTEAQNKDVLHALHQGALQSIHADTLMREGKRKGSECLDDSIASNEGVYVVPEDSSDQGRGQRTDLNFVKKLKQRTAAQAESAQGKVRNRGMKNAPSGRNDMVGASGRAKSLLQLVRPSLQEKRQKDEVSIFTNEQKRDDAFENFDDDSGKPDGCSQASEYSIAKCCKLLEETRTAQAKYGMSATSLSKYRLGEIVPQAMVEIPEDGDYTKLKVLPLDERKGGAALLQELRTVAADANDGDALEDIYQTLIQQYSTKYQIAYRGRFLVGMVNWSNERSFLGKNALEADPDNVYSYIHHFLRFTYGSRLPELTPERVIAAREASVRTAMEAATRRMNREAVDGRGPWKKNDFFERSMKDLELRLHNNKQGVTKTQREALLSARELVSTLVQGGGAQLAELEQLQALLGLASEGSTGSM